jgi:hypothetical protein
VPFAGCGRMLGSTVTSPIGSAWWVSRWRTSCLNCSHPLRWCKPVAADPVDGLSCRPDFLILGYPVITMLPPYAHEGSVANLLGENASAELRKQLSNRTECNSTKPPPTFSVAEHTDTVVRREYG